MNGKLGDNPLSDMFIHGLHPFPEDMEQLIREIHEIDDRLIDENFRLEPFDWEKGENLDRGRKRLKELIREYKNYHWENGEFTISTSRNRLQIDVIHKYLSEESYWAGERTREQTETAIKNSLPFGVYKGENLVGFARVVTDYATFAYLGDVFILEEFRRLGLSKWLMEVIINHPELQGFRRWILATRDAHALYEKFGFSALKHPSRWMEKAAPNAY